MECRTATLIIGGLALAMMLPALPSAAQQSAPPTSNRVALVIGEGAYRSGALPAAPNDAGLVAETLAGAGFDVTGARDLDGDGLRGAVRDFLARAGATGPDGIALVYVAGRALQFDGDNYFEPIDARLARPSDIPIETLRLGDLDRALAALPIQAKVVVVDGAYAGQPADLGLPPGLALVEAEQGELLAFNAAPGTVAPKTSGPYGIYAQSLRPGDEAGRRSGRGCVRPPAAFGRDRDGRSRGALGLGQAHARFQVLRPGRRRTARRKRPDPVFRPAEASVAGFPTRPGL